jgi:glucokinase
MILAADFGGTTIKLGIVKDGKVVTQLRLDAQAERPMTEGLEKVAAGWEQLLEGVGRTLRDCRGAALALPFLAHPHRAAVQGSFGKFPGADAIDFAAWSRKRLQLPIALENDLRVALLGEGGYGAARGKADVVMLALGTGIGCAVLLSRGLLRGAHNRAAALLGHSTVEAEGSPGRCGNIGCAEDRASTATLAERARKHPAFAGSRLAQAARIDFETLFDLAAQGDACAEDLRRKSLHVWAVVLQNAILAYDPEIVLLGGGVMRSAERRYMPAFPLEVPIVAGALGDEAALLGGEVLFQQTYPALFP